MENVGEVAKEDDEFEVYRKRMMLAYRFRPNPLVCGRDTHHMTHRPCSTQCSHPSTPPPVGKNACCRLSLVGAPASLSGGGLGYGARERTGKRTSLQLPNIFNCMCENRGCGAPWAPSEVLGFL